MNNRARLIKKKTIWLKMNEDNQIVKNQLSLGLENQIFEKSKFVNKYKIKKFVKQRKQNKIHHIINSLDHL